MVMQEMNNELFPTEEPDYSLLDRSSSEYRKAQVENAYIREELSRQDEEPLTKALSEAKHIPDIKKALFVEMSKLYLSNMQENIFKNQFRLNIDYDSYSADEWNDFLNDKIVSTYVERHKRTLLKAAAEDNLANPLAKNKRDNLKLIENIKQEERNESEKNIVIIRIPEIYDED